MKEIVEHIGDTRQVCLCREISKKFEETQRGNPTALLELLKSKAPKGEYVVIISSNSNQHLLNQTNDE